MKKYKLNTDIVKIVKALGIVDKEGTWVQVEVIDGKNKGLRVPAVLEELEKFTGR